MRNLLKREEYLSSSIVIVLDQISWLVKATSTWHLATQLDYITRRHRGRGNDLAALAKVLRSHGSTDSNQGPRPFLSTVLHTSHARLHDEFF